MAKRANDSAKHGVSSGSWERVGDYGRAVWRARSR